MQNNAADKKEVRKATKAAEAEQRADDVYLAHIMSTVQGRRWMWNKLESASVFENAFNVDSRIEAFNLGLQATGQTMLADITRVCPEQFIQAMRENNERRYAKSAGGQQPSSNASSNTAASERPSSAPAGRDTEGADSYPEPEGT